MSSNNNVTTNSISILELNQIGANISYTSVFPMVDLNATPNATTKRGNLQIIGNVILNGAGGYNFPPAAQAILSQTVTNAAQPNITSFGTVSNLSLLSVAALKIPGGSNGYFLQTNGNSTLNWGSIPVANGIANGSSNVIIPIANGNINFSAGSNNNVLIVSGTGIAVSGNANIGNIGTGLIFSSANIAAQQFISNIQQGIAPLVVLSTTQVANMNVASAGTLINGNSNVSIPAANGNINVSANGNANILIITGTGVNIPGNANIGNLVGAQISATTNITAPQLISNIITGTAPLVVTSTTQVANLNVAFSGTLINGNSNISIPSSGGNIYHYTTGNATSQLTITSLGVNIAGNTNVGNLITTQINATSNIVAPQLISNVTTGTAPLVVTSTTQVANLNVAFSGTLINGNSNISIPAANGNVDISINGTSNVFVVSSTGVNISGYANISGNANIGNIGSQTGVFAAGNITTINSGLLQNGNSNITLTSNANISHYVAGNATSQLTITSTGANISGTANITGNANIGNVGTAQVLATANITSPQLISNIATGTAPFVVNSTTQVANLTAATANVGLYTNVTAVTSGTYYPQLTSSTSGNTQTAANSAFSVNVANSSLIAPTFVGNLVGQVVNGNSNITISAINNNVAVSVGGVSNVLVITSSGANISGTANVVGNISTNANIITNNIVSTTSLGLSAAGTNGNINLITNGTGNIILSTQTYINNLAEPINPNDAASKSYVDAAAQGLAVKQSVTLATTGTLPAYTYNNGASGIGATLTATAFGTLSIDSTAVTINTRVLIKNEVGGNQPLNGIYTVTNTGGASAYYVLTRTTDFDTSTDMGGAFAFVSNGVTNSKTGWVCTTANPVNVGTTNILFSQFSGAGTYSAGTGLTLVGTQFNISNTSVTAGTYGNGDRIASLTINPQGQLTAASNTVITANAANLIGNTLNSAVVISSLTSVGTLGVLNVTGNANIGNIGTTQLLATANIATPQLISTIATGTTPFIVTSTTQVANMNVASAGTLINGASNISIPITSGNINISVGGTPNVLAVTATGANITGTANITGNANIGNIAATTGTFTTGNITTINSGLLQNGNSNINITANANISHYVTGNATSQLTIAATGVNIAGTANITGNANIGNVGTAQLLATANITAPQLISNIATGTAPLVVSSTTQVANMNVASAGTLINGTTNISIPVTSGNINLSSAGNANILVVTSIGVNITGTANISGNANIGNINTSIGNITTINSGLLQNGNSNITLTANNNISHYVAGNATSQLTITSTGANISGYANITGNANIGNVGTAQLLATANITAPQLISNIATGTAPLVVSSTTQIANMNVAFSGTLVNGNSNISIPAANGNINVSAAGNANILVITGTGANVFGTANITGNILGNNLSVTNYANIGVSANIGTSIILGNSTISTKTTWASVTTTSNTANQTISSFSVTGVTGVKYFVKGIDATGLKYSVATVQAITDGSNVNWVTYGQSFLGSNGAPGSLSVNVTGGIIHLAVTPASSNTTVWTTQYTII